MKPLVLTAMAALLLAGCASTTERPTATGPQGSPSAAPAVPAPAEPLLARYGLAGRDVVRVIEELDRLTVKDRRTGLKASVRPDQLVLSDAAQEFNLPIPDNMFYLSVAPYVTRTHECFYHSLTTCRGELAGKDIGVRIVNTASGAVLLDTTRTSYDNGFVGMWLPRDITGTLRLTYDGKVAETTFATGRDAPTCLTTLRLT